ncbi:PTS mannose/fructose/sorbose/N-acetylgalactosamine transporter subunit IIC [Enterococcus sp. LJL120]
MLNAFLVALVYYVATWLSTMGGIFHLNRPIVVGPLIGLVLGDLQTGIFLGATFESVFLGVIAVGGSVPADATTGAIMGTAIGILSGADSSTALAIAVPVSMLGVLLTQVTYAYTPLLLPKMDALAEAGDEKGVVRYNFTISLLFPLLTTVAIFFAVLLGVDAVQSLLNSIPEFVTDGFTAAAAMLPAVGFAMLLNMLFNSRIFAFFFFGFVLVIYLQLPTLAVAIIAVVFALWQFNLMRNNKPASPEVAAVDAHLQEEEDFFA